MNVKLNFVGVWAADFDAAFRFYTEVLGIESTRSSPGWAWFETQGMMFELFGGGVIDPQRAWGRGQMVRPLLKSPTWTQSQMIFAAAVSQSATKSQQPLGPASVSSPPRKAFAGR